MKQEAPVESAQQPDYQMKQDMIEEMGDALDDDTPM
jgi:hypothetical protein